MAWGTPAAGPEQRDNKELPHLREKMKNALSWIGAYDISTPLLKVKVWVTFCS